MLRRSFCLALGFGLGTAWTGFPLAAQESERQLAPGVLQVIPPNAEEEETFTGPVPLAEIVAGMPELNWNPNFDAKSSTLYERARTIVYHRPIWCLEFSFKPMRLIEVDIPQTSGKMQRKLIWYLVYRVRDVGAVAQPIAAPQAETLPFDRPGQRRFFPHIVLESHEYKKSYLSRVIPAAQEAIQRREMPQGGRLLNLVEMGSQPIPLSDERTDRGVWGVAMWEDVDPRIDFFSLYIRGLTNAFTLQVDLANDANPAAGPGVAAQRSFQYKTLQLNFWRPGDSLLQHESEFRYGVPIDSDPGVQQHILSQYGLQQRVDHRWIYR